MDKASASGAGDSRFESWAGHLMCFSKIACVGDRRCLESRPRRTAYVGSAECIGNPPLGAPPSDALQTEGASEQEDGDKQKRTGAMAEVLKETKRNNHGRNGECGASIAAALVAQLAAREFNNPEIVSSVLTRRTWLHRRNRSIGESFESHQFLTRNCYHQFSHKRGIYVYAHTYVYIFTYIYIYMCVCAHAHMYVRIYIYVCMYVDAPATRFACALKGTD